MGGWTRAWIALRGIVSDTLLLWAFRITDRRDPAYLHLCVILESYFRAQSKRLAAERRADERRKARA
jgi:hypothetical protein